MPHFAVAIKDQWEFGRWPDGFSHFQVVEADTDLGAVAKALKAHRDATDGDWQWECRTCGAAWKEKERTCPTCGYGTGECPNCGERSAPKRIAGWHQETIGVVSYDYLTAIGADGRPALPPNVSPLAIRERVLVQLNDELVKPFRTKPNADRQ